MSVPLGGRAAAGLPPVALPPAPCMAGCGLRRAAAAPPCTVRMPCSAGRSSPRAPDAHLPLQAAAPRRSCRAPAVPLLRAVQSPPSAPKEPLARGQKRRIAAAAAPLARFPYRSLQRG